MSTNEVDAHGTSFRINQPFHNVRLLELPEEVLDNIEKSDSGQSSLLLKCSPSFDGLGQAEQGDLHLCSDNKAWLVKQVSTSNSIYMTRISTGQDIQNDSKLGDTVIQDGADDTVPSNGLSIIAFAKPTTILELHAIDQTKSSRQVESHVQRLIPTILDLPDLEKSDSKSSYSRRQLCDNIPAPQNLIDKTLNQHCVFELPWSMVQRSPLDPLPKVPTDYHKYSKVYRPGPSLLLRTWRKIVEAATLSDSKITGDLEADLLLEAFADVDDITEDPHGVYKAVAKSMFERRGYLELIGIIQRSTMIEKSDVLHEMDLTRWVGNIILQTNGENSILKESFERRWEDSVPAAWAKYCSVEILGTSCGIGTVAGSDMVSWAEFSITDPVDPKIKQPSAAASESKGKRKWHEQFAARRNAKR